MRKSLMYGKNVEMVDIDRKHIKDGAQNALENWIAKEKLFIDENHGAENFKYRFIEKKDYKSRYVGFCYWISFSAHRPYIRKEGHSSERSHFDLWVFQDHGHWKIQPFSKTTLDDDFLILLESWKVEEKLFPQLKEEGKPTTIDDIFVETLQRLQNKARARLEVHHTYMEPEHIEIEEDESYKEIYVPEGEVEEWFFVDEEIKLYERNGLLLPLAPYGVEDLEKVSFGLHVSHPSIWDFDLPIEEWMKKLTDLKELCFLVNELADMGCHVTIREGDDSPDMKVYDVEYINRNDELNDSSKRKNQERYKIHYIYLIDQGDGTVTFKPFDVKTAEIPTDLVFWVWFDREDVAERVNHGKEDALTYYRESFLPKMKAARENGEIPSLLF